MITKIIDAHPDVAIFMENIFGLRRRHWQRADFWNAESAFVETVAEAYGCFQEPIVGNKVCTPDVWHLDEMMRMFDLFPSVKVVFIVRNPVDVLASRRKREDPDHYSDEARRYLCLDWRDDYHTWLSSWRQSIDVYWALRDRFQADVHLVYYDDFVRRVQESRESLFDFLGLDVTEEVVNWHLYPSHDATGKLVMDLKYRNEPVSPKGGTESLPTAVMRSLDGMVHYRLWQERAL